jgi:glycerol-3-phosphate dehydrogenase
VGGGASGAAVARDAALRGLAVALIERHDLAAGTSSRSSRLIHGGLRYLAQLELGLVREGLVERGRLLAAAPGLVRPVQFLYPVYDGDPDPLWRVEVGLRLYDVLAAGHSLGRHRRLEAAALAAEVPGLRQAGLQGAALYHDAACHDARLVLALALAARAAGATLVTRCALVSAGARRRMLSTGRWVRSARAVEVEDAVTGRRFAVRARAVVLCCGPWRDLLDGTPVRLRATRGSHIAVPRRRLPLPCHVALRSPDDGRLTFAMPVGDHTVFGTTDEDDPSPPAEVAPTSADVAYLLRLANHAFPDAGLSPADVSGVWAGLRPLVALRSRDRRIHPTRISRDHIVAAVAPGVWVLVGGKLTSHRRMAEDCLDVMLATPGAPRAGPCRTHALPLLAGSLEAGGQRLTHLGLAPGHIQALAGLYGARLERLAEKTEEQVGKDGKVENGEALLAAQVQLACEEEWALTLDDVLLRRLAPGPLDLPTCVALAPKAAELLAHHLGWSAEEKAAQVSSFTALVERELTAAGLPGLP